MPCGSVDEKLCDLRTVRLVRRQRQDHLHRADQPVLGKRTQQQPAALLDVDRNGLEDAAPLLM